MTFMKPEVEISDDSVFVIFIQIHGSTEFSFDVPDYQVMYKRSADNMYEDYENDEFLTIIVYVTESLTGNHIVISNHIS